jgi:hypothetical protein
MHATGLLSHWLAQHAVFKHRTREGALLKLVQALSGGSKLVLTQLGRPRRRGGVHEASHQSR